MPAVAIPQVTSTTKGVALPTEQDGDTVNGHYLQNSGRERFIARNSGATPRNVTISFNTTVDGQSVTSYVKALPAGESQVFGPFPTNLYGTQVGITVAHAEVKLRGIA